jgi:hypothetical protein
MILDWSKASAVVCYCVLWLLWTTVSPAVICEVLIQISIYFDWVMGDESLVLSQSVRAVDAINDRHLTRLHSTCTA